MRFAIFLSMLCAPWIREAWIHLVAYREGRRLHHYLTDLEKHS